jgi:hypothetical protein
MQILNLKVTYSQAFATCAHPQAWLRATLMSSDMIYIYCLKSRGVMRVGETWIQPYSEQQARTLTLSHIYMTYMRTYCSGKNTDLKTGRIYTFPNLLKTKKWFFEYCLSVYLYVRACISASVAQERVVECYPYSVLKSLFIIDSCP